MDNVALNAELNAPGGSFLFLPQIQVRPRRLRRQGRTGAGKS
jgi:hypothetical protein